MSCFNVVESNMILRRAEAVQLLKESESLLSISFPSLGAPDFTDPPTQVTPDDPNGAGRSIFFPDDAIYSGHPR
jgi:glutamate--cysteine ligase catalytic subunit